jgi:RNA polymerase sigma-70 factor (ECF subfamily)
MAAESDTRLIERAGRGCARAFASLYLRHGGALRRRAEILLGDDGSAEDLVQDVMLEAWQRAATYDPARGTVRHWLGVRLRCRAFDRLRRRGRQADRVPVAAAIDLDALVEARRAAAYLRRLPAGQSRVLERRYVGGEGAAEIARGLRIPEGTVKSRAAAGLRRLRWYVDGGDGGCRAPGGVARGR